MDRVRAGDPIQLNDLATSFRGLHSQSAPALPSRTLRPRQPSVFAHPEEGTVRYGVFLEREVTVAFTTPRTSIHRKSGCRGANRTLVASFKDSRPAIERPGITPPFTSFKHTNSW